MAYKANLVHVLKNSKGEYYTGSYRGNEKWDANICEAREFNDSTDIMGMIDKNVKYQEDEQYPEYEIEAGDYTIETKLRVTDK